MGFALLLTRVVAGANPPAQYAKGQIVAQLKTQRLQEASLLLGGGTLMHRRTKVRLFWAIN